jgi:isocitrate dehydrogenase
MTSVIESPTGLTLCETVHGTISKHFEEFYQLNETSSNSISTIFAWTKALSARARVDKNVDLINFAITLERITIETVMRGSMTRDLAALV